MRKILLISLAAVIVAGGIALVTYGQDVGGPPRGRPRGRQPGDRPGGEGQRRGPPRLQLSEEQQADLAKLMKEGKVGDHLIDALTAFQEAVKGVLEKEIKDEAQLNRAVRRFVFQTIMRQMRPPRSPDEEGGGRRRLEGRGRPGGPGGRPRPE